MIGCLNFALPEFSFMGYFFSTDHFCLLDVKSDVPRQRFRLHPTVSHIRGETLFRRLGKLTVVAVAFSLPFDTVVFWTQ